MSGRVDQRDVLDRAYDVVSAAEFELTRSEPVRRCECGATLLTWADDSDALVCAGCGESPSHMGDAERPRPVVSLPAPAWLAKLFQIGWRF